MKTIFAISLLVLFTVSCKNTNFNLFDTDTNHNVHEAEIITTEGHVLDYENNTLYEVTGNDTLASIARKYSSSPTQIIELNDLEKPYYLRPGTVIKVPTIRAKEAETEEEHSQQRVVTIKPSNRARKSK